MREDEGLTLEDLSQDVYLFGRVKLTQIHWLGVSFLVGLLLASLPLPAALRLVCLALPPAATAWFLHVDGPVWARRALGFLRRRRVPRGPLDTPEARIFAETATPLCDLGGGRFAAGSEVQLPPFGLEGEEGIVRRLDAWTALLNAAAAHGVQVDVFAARMPFADPDALRAAAGGLDAEGTLGEFARRRLRHFARRAAQGGYDTRVVVRLVTVAPSPQDAWLRFRACEAAFAGYGLEWEWASGAYLHALSREWADPGEALRRMAAGLDAGA